MGLFVLGQTFLHATPSVWDVLRTQLQLDHAVEQPQVQAQIRWLKTHPSYIRELAQSEPYIYHIVSEIKKRHLPGELALIPMIESTFDPFAYSNRGAVGLWQIMPKTGDELGLTQDWWFDGRRSIRTSTSAALNYFTYLRDQFHGNWLLAVAAYDAGEGTIGRAVKAVGVSPVQARFWQLAVPVETKNYVPRLLALAEIVQYPERYHVTLPDIPHVPYFEEVTLGNQIDLNRAAKLAGMSYRELLKLNPGYNHWTASPYQSFKLLIPTEKVNDFYKNLALLPRKDRVTWIKHRVQRGETIAQLAQQHFTSIQLIKELNHIKTNHLNTGQTIIVPSQKNTVALNAKKQKLSFDTGRFSLPRIYKVLHIVQPLETLDMIARKYHVSTQEIMQWNKLDKNTKLTLNQQLFVWKNTNTDNPIVYIVRKGDNINSRQKLITHPAV